MASRKRVVICVIAVVIIGLGIGLAAVLYPRGASPSAASSSVPSLTRLTGQLTSDDPGTEAQALAPGGVQGSGQPRTLLPSGSRLEVEPATWEVMGTDSAGTPAAGRIRGRLTEPGGQDSQVYLELIRINGRWLLYETSPA